MHRSPSIHERFLRHIWSRQYLRGAALRATDGRPIHVLDVGTLNLEGGPDFQNARVRIGSTTYAGDVEIHRTISDWFIHLHQEDPRYNKVILHVVLEGSAEASPTFVESGRSVPTLLLEPYLSESIRSIWQKSILDERARASQTIKCFRKNGSVGPEVIRPWVSKLAVERLELKLRRFEERLRVLALERIQAAREPVRPYGALPVQGYGDEIPPPVSDLTQRDFSKKELWEQLLYEGIMEGLGFSKNQESFVRLARSATLRVVRELGIQDDELKIQSLLLGAAGLLPKIHSLREKESRQYARSLTAAWTEMRKSFRSPILHAGDWRFFPTRPLNFPTLRLAAGSALIKKLLCDDAFHLLIQTLKSPQTQGLRLKDLQRLFEIRTTGYWAHHYHFDCPTTKPVTALGRSRFYDIVVNALLPLGLLYARIFKDKEVREGAVQLYEHIPAHSENALTRLMEKQLLKGRVSLRTASAQQGVIQLFKFYCTEERCLECEIGKIVFK